MTFRFINPNIEMARIFRWTIVPLLAVTLALAALVATGHGTAFAHTGEQNQPPGEIVSEQCHFLVFPYCFPPPE